MTYANMASARKSAKRKGYDFNAIVFVTCDDGRVEINSAPVDAVIVHTPVSDVWAYATRNRDVMTRKEIIHALRAMGYNRNMINTQISRFYTANGDRAAWYALNKSRVEARAAA